MNDRKVNPAKKNRLEFGHVFMALRAVRQHRGITISPTLHLDNLDWKDALVCPFPATVKSAGEYYLVCRESDADVRKIRLFRKWLLAQQAPSRRNHREQ